MKAFSSLALTTMMVCAALAAGACSTAEGECTYDTDCPQICYICDTTVHRCVKDLDCEGIQKNECYSDLECDPIQEYCYKEPGAGSDDKGECRPRNTGGDDDIRPDGDTTRPDNPVCNNPALDCSAPGLPNQGIDRDGDLWGECCDCLDTDSTVYPGRSELIYNCKDDDCDANSPDGDLDGDGYISNQRFCDAGPDCDDRDGSVYPGAPELCDGKDNDCDGPIDDDNACAGVGDIDRDGADLPPECPDLSGSYHIDANCMAINDADSEIVQDGCDLSINFSGIGCTGSIDAGMNLYIECAGIPVACTAKASLTSGFLVICSPECTFYFTRVNEGTDCTYHNQPECLQNNQVCGVVGEDGLPYTKCVNKVPGGKSPGFYCNPGMDIQCINELCINQSCAAICETQTHCAPFAGTTCQDLFYDDGHGTTGMIKGCAPEFSGETLCTRNSDCDPSRVCTTRALDNEVITVCRPPNMGGGTAGEVCSVNADCESNLCVCGDQICSSGQGVCSSICISGSDCVQGYTCGSIHVRDLQGGDHAVDACILDTSSCGRDDDCPSGKCCQIFVSQDGQSLDTICYWGGGSGESNTGESCQNSTQCCSVYCFDYPSYCMGLCLGEADCPVFSDGSCGVDGDCNLGYLCEGGSCVRDFQCTTNPFLLGYDIYSQPIIDTANLCMPKRRVCNLDSDCRSGESCKLYFNQAATLAQYQCEVGGPGVGMLGDDCWPSGSNACWSQLCLMYDGGGEGKQFCSQACLVDTDCQDPPTDWYCASIPVNVRPGIVSYIPACALRNLP